MHLFKMDAHTSEQMPAFGEVFWVLNLTAAFFAENKPVFQVYINSSRAIRC